jgi:adenylate cyclase
VVFSAVEFPLTIFLDPDERTELGLINAPLIVVYVIAVGTVLSRRGVRERDRALRWIVEGREPDAAEHQETLRLASRATLLTAAGWAGAGLVFSAINLTHSVGFAAVVAATVWLGGETTCALVYLITERVLRPVTALALAARLPPKPVSLGIRDRLLMTWSLGTGVPILGVLVVGVVGMTKPGVETEYVAAAGVFLGLVAMVVGLLATVVASRAIADPVTSVRAALERVARGDFDVGVAIDDGSEVGLLQAGFNRMADGLRERDRIRDLFGRQVGRDVALAALRDGTRLGGEEREIGAVFVDLVGSTSLALELPPTEVVELLNRFFEVVVEVVEAEGGLVNKFEGDAALCVFGAPVACTDPAADALRAARALARRLAREVPQLDFGIGVSAGPAVAGNVGAEQRFEYTVIGDPVNEAARLCDLAKQRDGRVLASEAALARAAVLEREQWELGDSAVLRGRDTPTGLAAPRSGRAAGRPA